MMDYEKTPRVEGTFSTQELVKQDVQRSLFKIMSIKMGGRMVGMGDKMLIKRGKGMSPGQVELIDPSSTLGKEGSVQLQTKIYLS